MQKHEKAKTKDIAKLLGLSMARTRSLLSAMDDVEALGENKARNYQLRKNI